MLHIIFCDDNAQYLESLQAQVQKACAAVAQGEQVFSIGPAFGSGQDVLQYVREHRVDVLLLDIDMPDMSGFDVAGAVCSAYPEVKIVFVSAYDNFVYSSFEYYPFAFLRKSHLSDELPHVLQRMLDKLNAPKRQLTLNTVEGVYRVDINSVLYVVSERNYCTVHTVHGTQYSCRSTLTAMEQETVGLDFYRIHSAFLVNLEHVEAVTDQGFCRVKHTSLPVAQKRVKGFKKAYMDYVRRCFNA